MRFELTCTGSFQEAFNPLPAPGLIPQRACSQKKRWLASVHSPRDPWSSAEALRHTGPRRWTTVYVPGGGGVRIARAQNAGCGLQPCMSSFVCAWKLDGHSSQVESSFPSDSEAAPPAVESIGRVGATTIISACQRRCLWGAAGPLIPLLRQAGPANCIFESASQYRANLKGRPASPTPPALGDLVRGRWWSISTSERYLHYVARDSFTPPRGRGKDTKTIEIYKDLSRMLVAGH